MTIFEELQAGYRLSQDVYSRYARDSLVAAHNLAKEFREYLGAPETYADPDDETRRPYVRLMAFQIVDGTPAAAPPANAADLLAREPDGFWRVALALTLDRDSASFPKQNLAFFLRMKVHAGDLHVQLLDGEVMDFHIVGGGDADKHALFGHMVDMVKRVLAAKPWEGTEKLPIGFDLEPPKPPLDDESEAILEAP